MIVETVDVRDVGAFDTGEIDVSVHAHDAENGAAVGLSIRSGGATVMLQLGIAKAREVAHAMLDMSNACDAVLTKELQA